jgi:flagellar operon protein
MMDISGVSVPFIPVGGVNDSQYQKRIQSDKDLQGTPFENIFAEEIGKIKFSGHAISRMASREIDLSNSEILRLENAVNKAEFKNSKDSLIMMDDKAFIINIPNKTVVTMFMRDKMEESVVTKIDSAVFA